MKKISKALFIGLLITGLLVACGGGSDPESVAKKFIKAISKADFKEAAKYASEGSQETLEGMQLMMAMAGEDEMMSGMPSEIDDLKVVSSTIDGDTAVVHLGAAGDAQPIKRVENGK